MTEPTAEGPPQPPSRSSGRMRRPAICVDELDNMTTSAKSVEVESRIERMRKLLSSPLTRRKPPTKVFGAPLDAIAQTDGAPVPFVVARICRYIEERGMTQEGLFRVSGNARLIERLKTSFDQSGDAPLETEGDVASAAALLKLFLRELPEPVVPADMHPSFLGAVADDASCVRRLRVLVSSLPEENFSLLKYLSRFLSSVARHEQHNRMGSSALGIVFGPNLFRVAEDYQGLRDQAVTNQVVATFIAAYEDIFEEPPARMEPLSVEIPCLPDMPDGGDSIPVLLVDSAGKECEASEAGHNIEVALLVRRKRKERRPSGDRPSVMRSSSEERPSPSDDGSGGGHHVRRCSSHEEVRSPTHHDARPSAPIASPEEDPVGPSSSSFYTKVSGAASSSDLSPHPPEPKRREIEGESQPSHRCVPPRSRRMASRGSWRRGGDHQMDEDEDPCDSLKENSLSVQDTPPRPHGERLSHPLLELHPYPENHEEGVQQCGSSSPPSGDGVPPLDLDTLHQHGDGSDPIPSEHRFSWPMIKVDEATSTSQQNQIRKASSYEAPLSPSAYRSYLSTRSLILDPSMPPSPPVEQENYQKGSAKEDVLPGSVKHLTKKIHSLKKKIKQFEENFEMDHGYRPSHAEKMSHSSAKKLLTELSKARKELKLLKEETQNADNASSPWVPEPSPAEERRDTMQDVLGATLKSLVEFRKAADRPENLEEMTKEQILEEKLAMQKALLRFESVYGRPSTREERDLMRPLYDRYRAVKRLVSRYGASLASARGAKEPGMELQPILEHVAMDFTSPAAPQDDEEEEEDDSNGLQEVVARKGGAYNNLHELPLCDLQKLQQQTRQEKRRLRRILREFEDDIQRKTGRRVQKEDRLPMESVYYEYKHVKAKLRLLEALVAKHEQNNNNNSTYSSTTATF